MRLTWAPKPRLPTPTNPTRIFAALLAAAVADDVEADANAPAAMAVVLEDLRKPRRETSDWVIWISLEEIVAIRRRQQID
jgi:hypothetical protein